MRLILVVMIACAATACASNGEGGVRAGGGSAGTMGTAGAGGIGTGENPTVIVPDAELCGGGPCAEHTGEQQFTHDGVPVGTDSLFDAAMRNPPATNAANESAIVYPSHETMFPVNVSRVRFEWTEPAADLAYELRFDGDATAVSIYTTGSSWSPTEEEWDWVAESNRGGAVRFTVTALDLDDPAQAWTSNPIDVFISEGAVPGAIYYWSTGTSGIMRARIEDSISQKFYTDPDAPDAEECVACHTVSRDGRRMAMGYGGEALRTIDIDSFDVLVPKPAQAERKVGWSTFSPDGELLLVSEKGVLRLLDTESGEPVGDNAGVVPLPAGKLANMPDWSALGDKVAFAMTEGRVGNKEIEAASIAVIDYDAGAWGAVTVLVESQGGEDNNFFPAWSPDSAWIAYVNAQQKSKDAVTATIRMISADGGTSRELTRLNERVNDEENVVDIGNAMPRWAPSTLPGTFWLAFSSLRAYATLRPRDDKEDQIWIAAVDPEASGDVSYAAFWAPFQSIEDGNHRAFWTVSDEDRQQQCLCVDICGDGIDNNCNGTADEAMCSECGPVEICDDGVDNNCNCVVDECVQEICNDGIDNDGDGLTDGADPSCIIVQ
ncbi:MAG: PD40 domain-containing protein [Deltaproteobacteria bacterium]|nr:PD40 domain-containing protein [Deltaproteobacteria bacterium]MBW2210948.1 PD40 domain-containing protein [Deltaproteobacteria bacterium]MBW2685701.1 PD40 domain-containing protein [Deltaproteobacteria bacterium]